MSAATDCIYEIEAATEQWTDHRVIHVEDLEDLLYFWSYVPKVCSQLGLQFKGFQLRHKRDLWLLTVKVMESGTPLIVFLSAATTMGCVRLFVSQLQDDRVNWRKDKYPWI